MSVFSGNIVQTSFNFRSRTADLVRQLTYTYKTTDGLQSVELAVPGCPAICATEPELCKANLDGTLDDIYTEESLGTVKTFVGPFDVVLVSAALMWGKNAYQGYFFTNAILKALTSK